MPVYLLSYCALWSNPQREVDMNIMKCKYRALGKWKKKRLPRAAFSGIPEFQTDAIYWPRDGGDSRGSPEGEALWSLYVHVWPVSLHWNEWWDRTSWCVLTAAGGTSAKRIRIENRKETEQRLGKTEVWNRWWKQGLGIRKWNKTWRKMLHSRVFWQRISTWNQNEKVLWHQTGQDPAPMGPGAKSWGSGS